MFLRSKLKALARRQAGHPPASLSRVFLKNNKRSFVSRKKEVQTFLEETSLPDGSRLPGWEKLKIGGPPISEQLERKKEERKFVLWEGTKVYLDGKGPRKVAKRKLAGPAMMRWYKPRMEEVMDRVWGEEVFLRSYPSHFGRSKSSFVEDPSGNEIEYKFYPENPRFEFISKAKQTKIDRMDRRKRAGKGTPKKGQGKRSGKKK